MINNVKAHKRNQTFKFTNETNIIYFHSQFSKLHGQLITVSRRSWFDKNVLLETTVARIVKLKSLTISLLAKAILLERIRLYETDTL